MVALCLSSCAENARAANPSAHIPGHTNVPPHNISSHCTNPKPPTTEVTSTPSVMASTKSGTCTITISNYCPSILRDDSEGNTPADGILRILVIANGLTPREPKIKISRRKGHLSKRTQFVRDIVKEVAGWVTHNLLRRIPLTVESIVSLHTSAGSSSCSATPRTSAPASSPRRGFASPAHFPIVSSNLTPHDSSAPTDAPRERSMS